MVIHSSVKQCMPTLKNVTCSMQNNEIFSSLVGSLTGSKLPVKTVHRTMNMFLIWDCSHLDFKWSILNLNTPTYEIVILKKIPTSFVAQMTWWMDYVMFICSMVLLDVYIKISVCYSMIYRMLCTVIHGLQVSLSFGIIHLI